MTIPIRARYARDEFGHKYVVEYRWQWPEPLDAPVTVARVVSFQRHPDEDTSRYYSEVERAALGLQWRYMCLAVEGSALHVEYFGKPFDTWVACGRTHDTMTAAVQAVLAADDRAAV